MINRDELISAFWNLRSSVITAHRLKNVSEIIAYLKEEYDGKILFSGYNCDTATSNDIARVLNDYYHISITHDELLRLLPGICNKLSLKYEPFTDPNDIERKITRYEVSFLK